MSIPFYLLLFILVHYIYVRCLRNGSRQLDWISIDWRKHSKQLVRHTGLTALDWHEGNCSLWNDRSLTGMFIGKTLYTKRKRFIVLTWRRRHLGRVWLWKYMKKMG